jgi:hypothetical protein
MNMLKKNKMKYEEGRRRRQRKQRLKQLKEK